MSSHSRLALLLVLAAALIASAWLWWRCTYRPEIPFLTPRGPAEWVRYPTPPNYGIYRGKELRTVFKRSFSLSHVPAAATLRVRAFRTCALSLNGQPVQLGKLNDPNWKLEREVEVAEGLKVGANEIVATVSNSLGPPALWLALNLGEGTENLSTDPTWQVSVMGATWRPARLASEPLDRSDFYPPASKGAAATALPPAERTVDAVLDRLPTLLFFAALAAAIWGAVHFAGRKKAATKKDGADAPEEPLSTEGNEHPHFLHDPRTMVAALAVLWIVLLINNFGLMDRRTGFDALSHLKYIQHILDNKALPLADEGWEMFQPPLYYLLSAMLLGLFGLSTADDGGLLLLGAIPVVTGIAHFVLVFACLKLLFPKRPQRQLAGVLLAAFLPAHIYISHYVTNEALAAVLISASTYLALRVFVRKESPSPLLCFGLGACLGGALLAKVTALLVAAVVFTALAGRLAFRKERAPRVWLRTLGAAALGCALVCGWHYLRVWIHFGKPLVGNWDPIVGFTWWADPGYHTLSYYLRAGPSLIEPFYSSLHGFADSLYSTLWGDALYGGIGSPRFRPPWNYELMAAGYLLSLLPMLAIVVGAVAALIAFVRKPCAEHFLLVGLAALTALSLLYLTLKLPYYAQAKAFYGLSIMIPLCAFGAWGFELLARRTRWLNGMLWIGFGTWALNAYATFWVPAGSAETHALRGWALSYVERYQEALDPYALALAIDPQHATAQWGLALALDRLGHPEEARQTYQQALEDHPHDPDLHLGLALVLRRLDRTEEAIREARKATELAPNHRVAYPVLGSMLREKGRTEPALQAYREAVRVRPDKEQLQKDLEALLRHRKEAREE